MTIKCKRCGSPVPLKTVCGRCVGPEWRRAKLESMDPTKGVQLSIGVLFGTLEQVLSALEVGDVPTAHHCAEHLLTEAHGAART